MTSSITPLSLDSIYKTRMKKIESAFENQYFSSSVITLICELACKNFHDALVQQYPNKEDHSNKEYKDYCKMGMDLEKMRKKSFTYTPLVDADPEIAMIQKRLPVGTQILSFASNPTQTKKEVFPVKN